MCLCDFEAIEVKSPIKVYKVVIHITDTSTGEETWVTPFRYKDISKEVIEGKESFIADCPEYDPLENLLKNRYKSIDYEYKEFIGKGYIHAYSNIVNAVYDYYSFYLLTYRKTYTDGKVRMPEIYECEIPVSTAYDQYCWKGMFDDTEIESVAAREMRFVRLLPADEKNRICGEIYDKGTARTWFIKGI